MQCKNYALAVKSKLGLNFPFSQKIGERYTAPRKVKSKRGLKTLILSYKSP